MRFVALVVGGLLAAAGLSVVVFDGGRHIAVRPDPVGRRIAVVGNRLRGARLYVDPDTPAAHQVAAWRAAGLDQAATALERIAAAPTATWLAGSVGSRAIAGRVLARAQRARSLAVLVLYDIPGRDCGGYSSGGATSGGAYLDWVSDIAAVIARRPVIVILEPDALDQAVEGCVGDGGASARYELLRRAVAILKSDPGAHVYLDAGHAGWVSWRRIAEPLRRAGVFQADGFALNVANFQSTSASIAYGRAISRGLGGRDFVIDTSRNGAGPPPSPSGSASWCNPPGRRLGPTPTTDTGQPGVDAYLWVKYPGASDGACRPGEPPAGAWWPSYALGLVGAH